MPNPKMTTFYGGEISPVFRGRIDTPKYYQSCRIIESMIVLPQGGVERIPGTAYVATSKTASKKIRLIDFVYSLSTRYVLEFGNEYIRVCKDHVQLGAPYEVGGSPPYLEADLATIQYVMIGADMYLFHPTYAPRKLVCTDDTTWTMSSPTFTGWDKTTEIDVTAITAASPAVVTTDGNHGYSNGDTVRIVGIKGMPEVNCKIYKVAGKTDTTFQLTGVDSTNFTPYVSGGTVIKEGTIFTGAGNYPSCATIYGSRLVVGATDNNPTTYWGSKVGDHTNMVVDINDDDAFCYEIGAIKDARLMWIVGRSNGLVLGSNIGEFIVPGVDGYLTPANALPYPSTKRGSMNLQAELVNDSILFMQRAGKRLREHLFNEVMAGYEAHDLTFLAKHVTGSGIVDMAVQTEPQTIVWFVTSNGDLISLVYEREYELLAWSRHPTDGTVESIAIIPTDDEDEIWLSVLRCDADSKRYIEYMKPRDWGTDQTDCFFVQSGVSWDGGAAVGITGASQEEPVVINSASHGFSNDEIVKIKNVGGMIELNSTNDGYYMIKNKADHTFELYLTDGTTPVDGAVFGAFAASIVGDTEEDNVLVSNVSEADIAALEVGLYITGTGIPANTRISTIGTDSFVMSAEATADGTDITISIAGTAQKVAKTVSGLGHLTGEEVAILYDGAAHPKTTVVAGVATLDNYGNKIHVGLSYTSKIQPMPIGTPDQMKHIFQLWIRFFQSLGCKAGPDEDNLETVTFRKSSDPMDTAIPLSDEDIATSGWKGGEDNKGDVVVVQDLPLPMTILSLIPEMAINED